jgi:hypothetical protein
VFELLPNSKAEQQAYRMRCCVTGHEREDNIKVHIKVLIGFNWPRIENGGCVGTTVVKPLSVQRVG